MEPAQALENMIKQLDGLTEFQYSGWKGTAIDFVHHNYPGREQELREILDKSKPMHEVIGPVRDFLKNL